MSSKDLEFSKISSLPLISLVPKTIDVVGDADVCNGEVADDVESEDLSFFKSRRKNPVVGSWNRTSKPRHWCPPARKTTHFCVRMLYEIESYLMNWTRVTKQRVPRMAVGQKVNSFSDVFGLRKWKSRIIYFFLSPISCSNKK